MLSQPSGTHIVCFESLYGSDMIYKKALEMRSKVTKSGSYLKIAVCQHFLLKYTKT